MAVRPGSLQNVTLPTRIIRSAEAVLDTMDQQAITDAAEKKHALLLGTNPSSENAETVNN